MKMSAASWAVDVVSSSAVIGNSVAASRKSIIKGKSAASKTYVEEVAAVSGAVLTENEAVEVTQAVCAEAEAGEPKSEPTYAESWVANAGSIGGLAIALEERLSEGCTQNKKFQVNSNVLKKYNKIEQLDNNITLFLHVFLLCPCCLHIEHLTVPPDLGIAPY